MPLKLFSLRSQLCSVKSHGQGSVLILFNLAELAGTWGGASLHMGQPLQACPSRHTRPRQGPLCLVYGCMVQGAASSPNGQYPVLCPGLEPPGWVEPSVSRGFAHRGCFQCGLGEQSGEWGSPWELTATALLPTVDKHGQTRSGRAHV